MKNILNKPALEGLGQKVTSAAHTGVARSKQMAEIAKLKMNNLSEEEAMKKAYTEIGKLYFAEHGDAPEGPYVALCSRICKAQDNIEANLVQIAALKQTVEADAGDPDDDLQAVAPESEGSAEPVDESIEPPLTADEEVEASEPIPDEE